MNWKPNFCRTKTVMFPESVNVIAPGEGDLAYTVKGWEADLELSSCSPQNTSC
ncbi:hypothetical protein LEMLEM_LOCUS10624 [Lemmus lemmus]